MNVRTKKGRHRPQSQSQSQSPSQSRSGSLSPSQSQSQSQSEYASLLLSHLRTYAFGGTPPDAPPHRVGAEVELIPVDAETRRIMPVERAAAEGGSTMRFLRGWAAPHEWTEDRSPKGVPLFRIPGGATLTFEPGGQIEVASPPDTSASALAAALGDVVVPLRAAALDAGIDLLALGLDPVTPPEAAPLQLAAPRYAKMAEYFAAIGPAGARMMRQSASIQVSVDAGDARTRWKRWEALNAAAPYLVALFANSRWHAGRDTGHASFRATAWRQLDPSRTGVATLAAAADDDPVRAYQRFAFGAGAMMRRDDDGRWPTFGELVRRGTVGLDEWEEHLSTLFPEVRPRGYFEVRSADAVDPAWYIAPLALIGGLAYGHGTVAEARDLLPPPDADRLERAGRTGLRDAAIAGLAAALVEIALAGCESLGDRWMTPPDRERVRVWCDAALRRGRVGVSITPPGVDDRGDGADAAGGYSAWVSPV